jgi:ribonuclease P protein component
VGKGKIRSLTQNYEFRRVYGSGAPYYGRYIVIYKKNTKYPSIRLGITSTKKIGKACVRNRARRLIFESFRLFFDALVPGADIVIVAKPAILGATFWDVKRETEKLLRKAGLLI